jgi:hypothetical protein
MRSFLAAFGLLCLPVLVLAADKEDDTKIITGVRGAVILTTSGGAANAKPSTGPAQGYKIGVLLPDKDTVVEEGTTDKEGKYLIAVPAGEYRVKVAGPLQVAGPRTEPVKVTVKQGELTEAAKLEVHYNRR